MKIITSAYPKADQAEDLLAAMFARLREPTERLAAFRTKKDRQLAVALTRKDHIYVWAECFECAIDGIEIQNVQHPGRPYAPDQPRSSAVNVQCSRLSVGNTAWYLRCDSLGALEKFAQWYAQV